VQEEEKLWEQTLDKVQNNRGRVLRTWAERLLKEHEGEERRGKEIARTKARELEELRKGNLQRKGATYARLENMRQKEEESNQRRLENWYARKQGVEQRAMERRERQWDEYEEHLAEIYQFEVSSRANMSEKEQKSAAASAALENDLRSRMNNAQARRAGTSSDQSAVAARAGGGATYDVDKAAERAERRKQIAQQHEQRDIDRQAHLTALVQKKEDDRHKLEERLGSMMSSRTSYRRPTLMRLREGLTNKLSQAKEVRRHALEGQQKRSEELLEKRREKEEQMRMKDEEEKERNQKRREEMAESYEKVVVRGAEEYERREAQLEEHLDKQERRRVEASNEWKKQQEEEKRDKEQTRLDARRMHRQKRKGEKEWARTVSYLYSHPEERREKQRKAGVAALTAALKFAVISLAFGSVAGGADRAAALRRERYETRLEKNARFKSQAENITDTKERAGRRKIQAEAERFASWEEERNAAQQEALEESLSDGSPLVRRAARRDEMATRSRAKLEQSVTMRAAKQREAVQRRHEAEHERQEKRQERETHRRAVGEHARTNTERRIQSLEAKFEEAEEDRAASVKLYKRQVEAQREQKKSMHEARMVEAKAKARMEGALREEGIFILPSVPPRMSPAVSPTRSA